MINFLKIRTSKLRGFLGVYFVLSLDIILFFLALNNNAKLVLIFLFFYIFIYKVIIQSKKDTISFNIYNEILTILENIEKRKQAFNILVFIICSSYLFSLFLVLQKSLFGYIFFPLIIIVKIIIYYICYKASKQFSN